MFKKVMPLIGLLLIASFVLAACQPAATPTAAPEQPTTAPAEPTTAPAEPTTPPTAEQVTITIWHQWDGKYLEAITQAFKDYEASHPNVKIDLSKPEDVANALNVAIPAGEGPDIIGWANDKIGEQALQGN
ncbi:MAG: ABC transporter substrate-binding protein, partial [Chloroflexota bacterium]